MSKADMLLKRATFFERLAIYSDRKVFLQALAQVPSGDSGTKAAVNALISALDNWLNTSAERQDFAGGQRGYPRSVLPYIEAIRNAAKYPSFDVNMLKRIQNVASELGAVNKNLRSESDNVRHSWINTVLPAATNVVDLANKQIAALNEWNQSIPQETSTETTNDNETIELDDGPKKPVSLPSINTQDQEAVFNFAVEQGGLVPNPEKQRIDGRLGTETRKALEAVKNYFAKQNPQNPRMTDQQAISAAKFKGR